MDQRILALDVPAGNYTALLAGIEGTLFYHETDPDSGLSTLHSYSLEERESSEFVAGIIGSFVGGAIGNLIAGEGIFGGDGFDIHISGLIGSTIGAIIVLGIWGFVRSRAWGMILALTMLIGYYGLFVYVQNAARMGQAPPFVLIWIPNALLLVSGAWLLWAGRRIR